MILFMQGVDILYASMQIKFILIFNFVHFSVFVLPYATLLAILNKKEVHVGLKIIL